MSGKNVDGVKKLSKEELDKSRNIVLDAISDRKILPKETKPSIGGLASGVPKTVDAAKKGPFEKNKIINKIIKKQTPVISEPVVELSENKKKKAREELNKIIPGQREAIAEEKIVSKLKEKAKPIPKEPTIKLSDRKKKKWREELNMEFGKKEEISEKKIDSKSSSDITTIPSIRNMTRKKISTDFLVAGSSLNNNSNNKKKKAGRENFFDIRARKEPEKIISRVNPFNNELVAGKIKSRETKEQLKPKVVLISKKENEKLIKAEEKRKKEKKKKIKEVLRQKKKEEKKRKQDTKVAQKAAKQKQLEIARKEYKEKMAKALARLRQGVVKISKGLLDAYKRVLILGLFGLAAALLVYASFLIVIIEYNIDNNVVRYIARLVPIPAYISNNGIVNYYTYRDIRAQLELSGLSQEELTKATKVAVVEKIIIDNLARHYGLIINSNNNRQADILALLNERIVFDQDINQVGIKRIRKIKELIDQSGDFVKVANKYGDDQDQITISALEKQEYEYYEKISDLSVGDVSRIITTGNGYYLFRCFDKKDDKLYLSYVHVAAKTLSEYIEESIMDYKLWSLVD